MHEQYLPKGFDKQLSHVIEECSEVIMAAAKIQRFGINSYNPLEPPNKQITNLKALRKEMWDATKSMERLEATIEESEGLEDGIPF